jgi:hypothetical protein
MATRDRIEARENTRSGDLYGMERPVPDEARLEAPGAAAAVDRRTGVVTASGLNVIAGIWLIISPFVLGYTSADARWNPIVFGVIAGVFALARLAGVDRTAGLSILNMAIGCWLFISAFWLAHSSVASWNVGILGVVVFVLGAWSAAATRAG